MPVECVSDWRTEFQVAAAISPDTFSRNVASLGVSLHSFSDRRANVAVSVIGKPDDGSHNRAADSNADDRRARNSGADRDHRVPNYNGPGHRCALHEPCNGQPDYEPIHVSH